MTKKLVLFGIVFLTAIVLLSGCSYEYLASLKPRTHTVRGSDESVYTISRKYGVPTRTIIEQNNLTAPFKLEIGQKVKVPRAPIHVVKKGDTLHSIASKYDVNMNKLIKLNKIRDPNSLTIGQNLLLPADFNKKAYVEEVKTTEDTATAASQTPPLPSEKPKETKKKQSTAVAKLPEAPKRSGKFAYPVEGTIISGFGVSGHGRRNDGINISAKEGTPIKSVENGVVAYAGNELKGFGNLILVKHSDGWITAYAHAKDISVVKGATVKKGDVLGHVGSTGNVKTPQLHFEIRKGTKAVDPMNYLKK